MKKFVIKNQAGLLLNAQKSKFNVQHHHFATFNSTEEAQDWIETDGMKVKTMSGKPFKLTIMKLGTGFQQVQTLPMDAVDYVGGKVR